MKSTISVILVFLFFSSAFSQKKTASDLEQELELENLKKEIFTLPVDKVIDTTAKYQLVFEQTGGWSVNVGDKNFNKRTNSRGNRIKQFSYSNVNGAKISSGSELNKGIFSAVNKRLIRKVKYCRFKDTDLKVILSFGGEYLIKVIPFRYVGNANSNGGVTYQYYKKLNN